MRRFIHTLFGVLILTLFSLLLYCCRTVRTAVQEKEKVQDSVRVEYKEKVVYVPKTVYIEVPKEQQARETSDTVSTLETSFATSTASIKWQNGIPLLSHSIANKEQKFTIQDSIPTIEKEVVKWKTKTVIQTKYKEKEKQLSKWDTFRLKFGGIAIIICLVVILPLIVGFILKCIR